MHGTRATKLQENPSQYIKPQETYQHQYQSTKPDGCIHMIFNSNKVSTSKLITFMTPRYEWLP
uniref:Uncharacterized protein n=1 Tax=Arundo donax TaxID=35708 RepID=A0A0A8XNL7_ARUDO